MIMRGNVKVILLFFALPLLPALFLQSNIKEYSLKSDQDFEEFAIDLLQAKTLTNVLWLDSRKKSKFEGGHVENAIWVSFKDWEGSLMKIFENFEPGQDIVVYCNASCSTSRNIAKQLRQELGQENIFYLKGGFESWQKLQK